MDTTVCVCVCEVDNSNEAIIQKARGGWNVSMWSSLLKYHYCSHIDCQDWVNLARESSHLKIFNN